MLKSFFVLKVFCSFTKNLKTIIMETIRKFIRTKKQKYNVMPYKQVVLDTGVICKHYSNGEIKVEVL